VSIDPKQGSVFQSSHEQEARNALDYRGVEQGRRPQISDGKKISTGSGTPEAFARGQALSKFARNEKIDFGRIAATRLSQLPEPPGRHWVTAERRGCQPVKSKLLRLHCVTLFVRLGGTQLTGTAFSQRKSVWFGE
jgi:hypothetical protein